MVTLHFISFCLLTYPGGPLQETFYFRGFSCFAVDLVRVTINQRGKRKLNGFPIRPLPDNFFNSPWSQREWKCIDRHFFHNCNCTDSPCIFTKISIFHLVFISFHGILSFKILHNINLKKLLMLLSLVHQYDEAKI